MNLQSLAVLLLRNLIKVTRWMSSEIMIYHFFRIFALLIRILQTKCNQFRNNETEIRIRGYSRDMAEFKREQTSSPASRTSVRLIKAAFCSIPS